MWEEVFPEGIDSSKMVPQKWNELAVLINERRPKYRGIVVIHGSDTLMYTAAGKSYYMRVKLYNAANAFVKRCTSLYHEIQSRSFLRHP